MTLPEDINPSGLQTWPLKNRVISTDTVKKQTGLPQQQFSTLPNRSTITTIDDVALEEKRLINALKNGVLVNEQPAPVQRPKEPEKEASTKWGIRNARRVEQQVPHPELTMSQKQHLRQSASNPIRPFLTRGSVAERVLIFERCPSDLLLDKRARTSTVVTVKPQVSAKKKKLFLDNLTIQSVFRLHQSNKISNIQPFNGTFVLTAMSISRASIFLPANQLLQVNWIQSKTKLLPHLAK